MSFSLHRQKFQMKFYNTCYFLYVAYLYLYKKKIMGKYKLVFRGDRRFASQFFKLNKRISNAIMRLERLSFIGIVEEVNNIETMETYRTQNDVQEFYMASWQTLINKVNERNEFLYRRTVFFFLIKEQEIKSETIAV